MWFLESKKGLRVASGPERNIQKILGESTGQPAGRTEIRLISGLREKPKTGLRLLSKFRGRKKPNNQTGGREMPKIWLRVEINLR